MYAINDMHVIDATAPHAFISILLVIIISFQRSRFVQGLLLSGAGFIHQLVVWVYGLGFRQQAVSQWLPSAHAPGAASDACATPCRSITTRRGNASSCRTSDDTSPLKRTRLTYAVEFTPTTGSSSNVLNS